MSVHIVSVVNAIFSGPVAKVILYALVTAPSVCFSLTLTLLMLAYKAFWSENNLLLKIGNFGWIQFSSTFVRRDQEFAD